MQRDSLFGCTRLHCLLNKSAAVSGGSWIQIFFPSKSCNASVEVLV